MKEEKISSRGRYDHAIEISATDLGVEGVNICYEFRTRSNDIGFEAKFTNKKGEEKMVRFLHFSFLMLLSITDLF
jgi:hypothetical protein